MSQHKIVLALQFWEGDKETAMRNARRIADNEVKFRDDVEFCFVARFDCAHDLATVNYVGKKMRVSTYTSARRGTGWPHGCNEVWCDAGQEWVRRTYSGKYADVKAIFTFEADCVPIDPDWISKLHAEWDITAAEKKLLFGCWQNNSAQRGHINGNMVFHPLLVRTLNIVGCTAEYGWDAVFASTFSPHWRKSGLIQNYYHARNVSDEDILKPVLGDFPPVLIHGVKDLSVEKYADRVLRRNPA